MPGHLPCRQRRSIGFGNPHGQANHRNFVLRLVRQHHSTEGWGTMRRTAAAVLGRSTCLAIGEDGRVEASHAVLHHGQADHCRPHSAREPSGWTAAEQAGGRPQGRPRPQPWLPQGGTGTAAGRTIGVAALHSAVTPPSQRAKPPPNEEGVQILCQTRHSLADPSYQSSPPGSPSAPACPFWDRSLPGRTLEDVILRSIGAQHSVKLQRVAAPRLMPRAVGLQRLPRPLLQTRRACARAPAPPQRCPLVTRSLLGLYPCSMHVGSMPLQSHHCRGLEIRSVEACLCLFNRACQAAAAALKTTTPAGGQRDASLETAKRGGQPGAWLRTLIQATCRASVQPV